MPPFLSPLPQERRQRRQTFKDLKREVNLVTIRCFVAVELPEALKKALESLRTRMDLPQFDVRWVQPANLHLTLRFLGEIPEEKLPLVEEASARAAGISSPFSIKIQGLGAFPKPEAARVVWVGVDPEAPLIELEKKLSRELSALKWPPPDKPFRPHLTLGRVKSSRGLGELRRLLERNREEKIGEMVVEEIRLIRSQLQRSGPIYTVLRRFPFSRRAGEAA